MNGRGSILKRYTAWIPFALAAFGILFIPVTLFPAAPQEHVIPVEASRFAYGPSTIRVNPGDSVTLSLTSTDVVHGLAVEGYGLQLISDPGQTESVTFTAGKPGVFRFYCPVTCGDMHPFMVGKFQVGPNILLLRAVGLAVLVVWAGLRRITF